METEYQDFKMVCSNPKCKHNFRLQKKERYVCYPSCVKCGNGMSRELSDEYVAEFTELEAFDN